MKEKKREKGISFGETKKAEEPQEPGELLKQTISTESNKSDKSKIVEMDAKQLTPPISSISVKSKPITVNI